MQRGGFDRGEKQALSSAEMSMPMIETPTQYYGGGQPTGSQGHFLDDEGQAMTHIIYDNGGGYQPAPQQQQQQHPNGPGW